MRPSGRATPASFAAPATRFVARCRCVRLVLLPSRLPAATIMTVSVSPLPPSVVIRPPSRWRAVPLKELWRYRDLLLVLARREVTLRYRQTALGVVWVLMQPLAAAAIFTAVFSRVANLRTDGVPYFLFAYA